MYPEFNEQGSQPFPLRKRLDDQPIIPNPSSAADGFNIWWQKTIAQNMATVAEAYDLMRAHRLDSSEHEPRARQAH